MRYIKTYEIYGNNKVAYPKEEKIDMIIKISKCEDEKRMREYLNTLSDEKLEDEYMKLNNKSNENKILEHRGSDLRLSDLTKVSNNSHLTQDILEALNNKLSDIEKDDFLQWLKLVEDNIDQAHKANGQPYY